MAKRKRLTPANTAFLNKEAVATPAPVDEDGPRRAPIANVASEASAVAAAEELSQEMSKARETGRWVQILPLDRIDLTYLVRDRIASDEDELDALVASIRARGQQTPIEVVEIAPGQYGLISGWRRCEAVRRLQAEGDGDGQVLALLRKPESAEEAYLSMVEENEIRVGLSYFERARIAHKAVELGVFEGPKAALLSLYHSASRAKRSKIRSFLTVVDTLETHLKFPQAIGERLGLQLAKRLEDPAFVRALQSRLSNDPAPTPEAELAHLTQALSAKAAPSAAVARVTKQDLQPGLTAKVHQDGRVELSGVALTEELRQQLFVWLQEAAGSGR